MRRFAAHGLLWCCVLLTSCGGGGGGDSDNGGGPALRSYNVSNGVAQKGPFVKGSTITIEELDSNLVRTGKQHSYQVTSDLGTFVPTGAVTSRYVVVTASGTYFDEVTNSTSAGPVKLTAISDLTTDSALNVNVLTTLESLRIQVLVQQGMTFLTARTQAESEALAVFHLDGVQTGGPFDMLDLSKGLDGDQILAAISSVFAYGNTPDALQTLLIGCQANLAESGHITDPVTTATLVAAAKAVNPVVIANNLNAKYASAGGVPFTAADLGNWLDQIVGSARKIASLSLISGLSSLEVTSATTVVPVGMTQQFKATGTFADGSTADLTNEVVWTSSVPAAATVDAKSGLVVAVAAGESDIIATSGRVAASLPVTVPAASSH